jgi:hypothetical protein
MYLDSVLSGAIKPTLIVSMAPIICKKSLVLAITHCYGACYSFCSTAGDFVVC